jgi:hypothetical protein
MVQDSTQPGVVLLLVDQQQRSRARGVTFAWRYHPPGCTGVRGGLLGDRVPASFWWTALWRWLI